MNAPFDHNDPAAISRAERAARVVERERSAVIKSVMQVRAGRELVHNMLSQLGVFRTPFSSDPHTTAFNCGVHNAGLMWFAMIMDAAPDQYILMMKENSDASRPNPADASSDGSDDASAEPN